VLSTAYRVPVLLLVCVFAFDVVFRYECSVYYGNKNLSGGVDNKGRGEMDGRSIREECLQRRRATEHAAALDGSVAHVPLANDDERRDLTQSPTLRPTDAQSTVVHPRGVYTDDYVAADCAALTDTDDKLPTVTCNALTTDSASITWDVPDAITSGIMISVPALLTMTGILLNNRRHCRFRTCHSRINVPKKC